MLPVNLQPSRLSLRPMRTLYFYHNPRCSKSRAALALLEARGIKPELRLYLEQAPSAAEIRALLKALQMPARDLIRRGEALYKTLALADADEETLIAAIANHPILLERPILSNGKQAQIGRPPENVLKLLV